MARIAGVDLPRDKRIEIALTYIFGIGLKTSQKNFVMPSIRTLSSKVTFVAHARWTLSDSLISAATVAAVTVSAFLSVVRTRRTMPARAKARKRLLQARRRTNEGGLTGGS